MARVRTDHPLIGNATSVTLLVGRITSGLLVLVNSKMFQISTVLVS